MGRPEKDLASAGGLGKLAQHLRLLRQQSSLTYREMAAKTHLRASTLSRAADGSTLPRWDTVAAYTWACGADAGTSRRLWEKAAAETHKRCAAVRRSPRRPTYPGQVTTVNGLAKALRYLRLTAGQPSLEMIELTTSVNGTRLPRSTASDLLRGNIHNPSLSAVLALAQACREMDPDAQRQPGHVWHPVGADNSVTAAELVSCAGEQGKLAPIFTKRIGPPRSSPAGPVQF
jgi:transcriptional regulator with XRE-family HTH domain